MTSIISEFHSVTYRCKSTAVHISEINIRKNNDMAPQQHDTLPKSSDMEAKEPQKSSPVSNLGTSVDSSPPLLPSQETSGNMNEYETERRTTVYDPSSEDSGSIQSNYDDQDEFHQSPLERLQCTFGKDGRLPQTSPLSNYSSEKNRNCLPQGYREAHDVTFPSTPSGNYNRNIPSTSSAPPMFDRDSPFMAGLEMYPQPVPCHSCSYVATTKQEYDAHSSEHFEHKCTQCNYASRTEGRLKRHISDFHSDIPPESWSGSKTKKKKRSNSEESMDNCVTSSNGKSRKFKCKHCTYVCGKKDDFWKHTKLHMKPDKILQCPHCDFASEFKHHFEYHIANHFGRKPFKCSMCNYKCVNKSMLNSHMKSHSNVYQFRCATCSYVTKYCHSIKQHLKTKQGHEAGPILNQDGTPSTIQMIDVYGRRRGPRTKKRKNPENPLNNVVSSSSTPASQQIMPYSAAVPMLPPAIYPSMEYAPNFFMGATHQVNSGYSMPIQLPSVHLGRYECSVCRYVTNDLDSLNRHIITHAGEYPDIAKLYGINPDVLSNPHTFSNMMRQRNYLEQMESNVEKSISPRNEKVSSSHGIVHGEKLQCDETELEARSIKSEERSSPDYHRHLSSSPRNESDSFKEFSSPSPAHSTVSLPDFLGSRKKQDVTKGSVIVTTETATNMEVDSYSQPKGNDSPIDLSSPKSDSPKSDKSKILETASEQQSLEVKSSSQRGAESSNITSTNRHRRKGKAFKIDHYIQYDEQQELLKKGEIQFINPFQDDTMEDIERLWTEKIGQSREQKTEIVISDKHPAVEFPRADTSNKVFPSPQELSSQNQLKTPQVQSLNILNGNHQISKNASPNLEHNNVRINDTNSHNEPTLMSVKQDDKVNSSQQTRYECIHCKTTFGDWFIYSVHMGFHGPQDPFTCKSCGCVTKDAVQFFIHLVRESH